MAIKKEFQDERGIMRRVVVDKANTRPSEGIPIDVFDVLDEMFEDCPLSFRKILYNGLWARGLIEKEDFSKRTALNDLRSALQASIARDASDIILKIKE